MEATNSRKGQFSFFPLCNTVTKLRQENSELALKLRLQLFKEDPASAI
jgi:hypothetical protein